MDRDLRSLIRQVEEDPRNVEAIKNLVMLQLRSGNDPRQTIKKLSQLNTEDRKDSGIATALLMTMTACFLSEPETYGPEFINKIVDLKKELGINNFTKELKIYRKWWLDSKKDPELLEDYMFILKAAGWGQGNRIEVIAPKRALFRLDKTTTNRIYNLLIAGTSVTITNEEKDKRIHLDPIDLLSIQILGQKRFANTFNEFQEGLRREGINKSDRKVRDLIDWFYGMTLMPANFDDSRYPIEYDMGDHRTRMPKTPKELAIVLERYAQDFEKRWRDSIERFKQMISVGARRNPFSF